MSVLSTIRRWFSPSALISREPPEYRLQTLWTVDAGIPLTPDAALQVSAVYACVDVIVRAIAPAPWLVYQVEGSKRTLLRDDLAGYVFNVRGNTETTAVAVREALLYSALIFGNGYAEIERDGSNRLVGLWPLDPQRVIPRRDPDGRLYYEVQQFSGGSVAVDPARMFHLRGPSFYGFVGDNVLWRATKAIAVAAASQQFSASYFQNGGSVSGVIQMPGELGRGKDRADTIDLLRKQWVERYGGPAGAHVPLILEKGASYTGVGGKPDDAQLIDQRKFSVAEIARFFGVPLHKLQDPQGSQGYGSNIESMEQQFTSGCLGPWVRRLEQEANFKIFRQRNPWKESCIDLSRLHQGDFKTRMEAYSIAKRAGILNQNEIREEEGWNTIGPDGDVYTVETAMQTVERLIEGPEKPEPAVPTAGPDAADPGDAADSEALKEAAAAFYAGAFQRYAARMRDRACDLATKHPPETVEQKLSEERERAMAQLREECEDAVPLVQRAGVKKPNGALAAFAGYVERGENPRQAAARMLGLGA